MTITLSDAQERLITEALKAGNYGSVEELLARALEILRAEDGFLQEQRNEIGTKIDRALAQFECGEFLTGEQSRADMEKR